jgi:plasmid stability protein
MNRTQAERVSMRLPSDVRQWLEVKAAARISSMTTEAVAAIRAQMAQEHRERGRAESAIEIR